jgi:uroporphyrinogen decarboxylase
MVGMTKRERVERTMALQETDRVPLYDLLFNDGAIEYFSGEKLPVLVDDAVTRAAVNRMTGVAISRFLDMTRAWDFGPLVDRDFTDEDGFVHHESVYEKTSWIKTRPFKDEAGAAEYLKKLTKRLKEQTHEVLRAPKKFGEEYKRYFIENTSRLGDTIHLITQHGTGLDDLHTSLGIEMFVYLYASDPGLVAEAWEAYTAYNIAVCHAIADLSLSPLVLTYGDIAYKNHLIYSPKLLRKEFFPRLKRINDAWHEHGFKCLYHSDGYLMEVMDDLIATGIDGLNPIETVAGMSLKEVRAKYPQLFLAGGIDMSQLLSNGTVKEVKEVCRQAIRDVYPGFFMGSTTEADNSCKTENLVAMYEVAHENK